MEQRASLRVLDPINSHSTVLLNNYFSSYFNNMDDVVVILLLEISILQILTTGVFPPCRISTRLTMTKVGIMLLQTQLHSFRQRHIASIPPLAQPF
ncbi:hypothetical protein PMIN01_00333 [Paraphaeosphaeria minitans]|uniref:Uncharacterized protein n=1 Tax=Paraphaeosphaeria minitans TaxID=565426 RepID=A0A9P6GV79_9PLEO|nr:hypothetical protein PMIN01_00333 [Paraphaeosphaeria minitans]